MVTRIDTDGRNLRLLPCKFASIADAHNFNVEGPWRSSFEGEFADADDSVADVMNYVLGLETVTTGNAALSERLVNVGVDRSFCAKLAELVASLLARSPRIRHLAKVSVDHFGAFDSVGGVPSRDPVIAGNVRIAFSETKRHMVGGVWILLYSDSAEFIYGDGHFSSFGISCGGSGNCIIPLLPTVAAAYVSLIGPYMAGIRTLRLNPEEVASINELTQIYSKDYLFARSQIPTLIEHFTTGEHLTIRFHRFEWLEAIKEVIEVPGWRQSRGLLDFPV